MRYRLGDNTRKPVSLLPSAVELIHNLDMILGISLSFLCCLACVFFLPSFLAWVSSAIHCTLSEMPTTVHEDKDGLVLTKQVNAADGHIDL